MYIRINTKNINFGDKKIKKSEFYKNKKAFQLVDIGVVSKKNHMAQKCT